jgi:hypothetical protein
MSPTQRYRRIAQIMDEAYREYENGLVALRKRVVADMKRRLSEAGVLDRPDLEQSLPRERPGPALRRRRARRSRKRRG